MHFAKKIVTKQGHNMTEQDLLKSFSMTTAISHSIIAVDCHPTEQLRPGLVRKFFLRFLVTSNFAAHA